MKKNLAILFAIVLPFLLTGCAEPPAKAVDLTALGSEIETEIALPDSMEDITAGDLQRLYGIDSAQYVQFIGKITTVGVLGDEIVVVEAVDADAVAGIQEKMENRYQAKRKEMEDYLPEEYEKINNGGVVTKGNYVALLVSSEQEKLEALIEVNFDG